MLSWLFIWVRYPRFFCLLLCLYELFLFQQRRKKKQQTYFAASKRSEETKKPLLVLGRHPSEDIPEIEKCQNEINVDSHVEQFLSENNVDNYIIFESGVFTRNTNFKM